MQASTNRAAIASGRRPDRFRWQSRWKNRASCGRRATAFSKSNSADSSDDSVSQAVQRSQVGNGMTGTPTRAAGPFGSWSRPSIQGAGRNCPTPRSSTDRTASSSRGSATGAQSKPA